VFILSFGTVTFTIYNKFDRPNTNTEYIISLIDDVLYTIHFLIILLKKEKIYKLERSSLSFMLLHFLSG